MAKSLKPKKGLEVKIIAGKYKGQVGKVLTVFPKTNKLIISHAKSFNIDDKFNLVGGVDNNIKSIAKFKEKYKHE